MSANKKPTKYALGYEVDGSLKILTENGSILFAKHSNGKSSINPDMNKVMYFSNKEAAIKEAESHGHAVNGHRLVIYTCDEDAPTYIDRNGEGYE